MDETSTRESPSATLRLAMKANGSFSGLSGLGLILAAGRLGPALGVNRWVLIVIGVLLVMFAASLWRSATRVRVEPAEGRVAVWADGGWVVGSAVVVAAGPLTPWGNQLVGVVAVIVLAFAVWQHLGVRKLTDAARAPRSTG
jgi:hypothetical protein